MAYQSTKEQPEQQPAQSNGSDGATCQHSSATPKTCHGRPSEAMFSSSYTMKDSGRNHSRRQSHFPLKWCRSLTRPSPQTQNHEPARDVHSRVATLRSTDSFLVDSIIRNVQIRADVLHIIMLINRLQQPHYFLSRCQLPRQPLFGAKRVTSLTSIANSAFDRASSRS